MRRSYGSDAGLSIRMAVALGVVALIYAAAEAVFLWMAASAAASGDWGAAAGGAMFAAFVVLALVAQLRASEAVALRAAGARLLEPGEEPDLDAVLARAAAQADLAVPRAALVRSWAPNAFAVGRDPSRAVVVVTTELLRRLRAGELEAVVAHELAHIANRDGPVMTFVSGPALLGSALLRDGDVRLRILWFTLYWPIHGLGLLLQRAISRYREYAADRGAALITGAPEQLMSALQTIYERRPRGDLRGGAAVSALCIVPTRARRLEVLSDHPPLEKRLARLAELARELGRPVA